MQDYFLLKQPLSRSVFQKSHLGIFGIPFIGGIWKYF